MIDEDYEYSGFTDRGVAIAGIVGKMLYRWIILCFVLTIHYDTAEYPSDLLIGFVGFFGFFSVIWMGIKEFMMDLWDNPKYDTPKQKEDE